MNSSYYGDPVNTSYGISDTTGLLSVFVGLWTFIMIFALAASVIMVVSLWKIFTKQGKPGWAAIIPIYNIYVMCEIAGKEWWYILLLCIPIVNIYAMFVIYDGIAKKFNKTTGFTIGMIFLPYIFFPILAFAKEDVIIENNMVSNDNVTENLEQDQTITNDFNNGYINESVQPMEQGYVAPTFDTQPQAMGEAAMPNMNEMPMMNQSVTPIMNETSMKNQPVTPIVNEASMMNQPVAPVVNETPMMNQPVAPVVEPTPIISEPATSVAPQQEVNQTNSDVHTSLWSNNNNGQM